MYMRGQDNRCIGAIRKIPMKYRANLCVRELRTFRYRRTVELVGSGTEDERTSFSRVQTSLLSQPHA